MYILLVAATAEEIKPTTEVLEKAAFSLDDYDVEVLITGVGLLTSTYLLADTIFRNRPDFIVQAGIAGSFDHSLPLATPVLISEEVIGDMGVTEDGDFNDVFDMRLADPSAFPYTSKCLVNPASNQWQKYELPIVRGVTINMITTGNDRIELLKKKYKPVTESMEGAALHFVCLEENIPFLQLRAISNFAGERDKNNWKIKEAIEALNKSLLQILKDLP